MNILAKIKEKQEEIKENQRWKRGVKIEAEAWRQTTYNKTYEKESIKLAKQQATAKAKADATRAPLTKRILTNIQASAKKAKKRNKTGAGSGFNPFTSAGGGNNPFTNTDKKKKKNIWY